METRVSSRIASRAGLAAAIWFLAVVAAGIAAVRGFNAVDQPISALYESGARLGPSFQIAFIAYNVLLMAFGSHVFREARSGGGRRRLGMAGAVALALTAAFGIVDDLAPQDRYGAAITAVGRLHWISTSIAFAFTILALVLLTAWLRKRPGMRALGIASIPMIAIAIAAGLVSGPAMSGGWPLLGIYETIVMLVWLAWIASLSMALSRRSR